MAADLHLRTYVDAARKPDVLSLVEILTARENWFLNNLGKSVAKETTHQTQTDTLRTAATAAIAEGGDYTMLARTTPTLVPNVIEIVAIPFAVTRTQQQIAHYHEQNELARQTTKALMDWGNAAEFDLVRSTLVSGVSGTAPKMNKALTQCLKEHIMKIKVEINKTLIYICLSVNSFAKIVANNLALMIMQNFAQETVG